MSKAPSLSLLSGAHSNSTIELTPDTGGTVLLVSGGGLLLGLGGGGRQGGHFGGEALEVGLKLVLWNGTN